MIITMSTIGTTNIVIFNILRYSLLATKMIVERHKRLMMFQVNTNLFNKATPLIDIDDLSR